MSPARIRIRLRPSPTLASLIVIGHLMGLWGIGTGLEGFALVSAAAGVLLSAIWTTGQALQQWADSPLEIELREDGTGTWLDRRSRRHEIRVLPGGYVSLWLIIVLLTDISGRRKWVVIPQDAAGDEDRRRLRVWMRWQKGKIDADGDGTN